jgi:DNA-binding response OmpR family regulator
MYRLDKPRVLVVDDEPSICKALKRALGDEGYDVTTACTGDEAEARIRTEWFDLAVIDLRLKENRGDRIFYFAVGHQPHLEHQTVFITGDITEGGWNLIRATECPMLLKPFNNNELFNLLTSLLPRADKVPA